MDVFSMLAGAIASLALAQTFLNHPAWGHFLNTLLKAGAGGYLIILGGLEYLGHGTLASSARPSLFWIGVVFTIIQIVHINLSFERKKHLRRKLPQGGKR